jgi:death-on-curing protein
VKYLTVERVLLIHAYQIARFGGEPGVRDPGLLDSAVAQPRAAFGGTDLYPTLAEKAGALAFSLVLNHPFFDGNKRTGHASMAMFLSRNGHTLDAPQSEQAEVIERLAAGALSREGFVAWVRARVTRKPQDARRRPPGPSPRRKNSKN